MNNYDFWEEYIKNIKEELKKLCNKKNKLKIDLHIHSTYSADGKQTIQQILTNTRKENFDVISITDHDTLNAYDEIYEYVKNGITNPIIIPGIEFTIDNKEYGNQCHMIQLFLNPKDETIIKDVNKNYQAMFNRSKIQFDRLKENKAFNELLSKYDFIVSYEEYIKYLNEKNMVPEYDTLALYLTNKLKEKEISVFELLELSEKYNKEDCYEDRKMYKINRFNKIKQQYENTLENMYNPRVLISSLAVREVDDDWWDKPSSGSLSVNSYGQLKIEDINEKYGIYFAHPTESKLKIVEKIVKSKKNIVGLELNVRNKYKEIQDFYKIINNNNLLMTIGSDNHENSVELYENDDFYIVNSNDFLKIINIDIRNKMLT